MTLSTSALGGLLQRHQNDPSRLVQILREVQDANGVISPRDVTELAQALGLPRARVEGVAGFYSFLSTVPRGQYRVLFSDNITDQLQGSHALRDSLCHAFEVHLDELSRDGLVSIGATSCTGLGDQGPALLVNGRAIGRLDPGRIGVIAALIRGRTPLDRWPKELFAVTDTIHRADLLLASRLEPGEAIDAAIVRGAQGTIEEVKQSRLRGRGGAGFSTATKWEACRVTPGPERFVVCNADEGEPGTFKDRVLLRQFADLVVEGMTVCAWAVGAQKGFIYLRGEYLFLLDHLEAVLQRRREAGLLGHHLRDQETFDFDVEVHLGAGAYVCGEESALIESLEGKRGIPRNRPPYPVTHGYKQKPTVVNNVETLAAAALIARHGAAWFTAKGTATSAGTKIHSVSGDVARPGLYELPWGTTIAELLELAGAKNTQAVQVGGPSGVCLASDGFKRRFGFEDVPTAGAFMVFDSSRAMVEVAENFARFFAHESCGFCTPCRVGTTLMHRALQRIVAGHGTKRDLKELKYVAQLLKVASHCGLGTTAGNPVLDTLERFRPSYQRRIRSFDVLPSFDLDQALAPAREITGRDDPEAHFEEDAP
ncbi:MAG: NAD(P)H-dependent oxidoreductase subunit E [Myxococcales bacterium]|nr:NAD(P)H-dependent oxidoreductase subunit E [Myxococcales bacterium]